MVTLRNCNCCCLDSNEQRVQQPLPMELRDSLPFVLVIPLAAVQADAIRSNVFSKDPIPPTRVVNFATVPSSNFSSCLVMGSQYNSAAAIYQTGLERHLSFAGVKQGVVSMSRHKSVQVSV
jgi:hypothetical protein